MGKFNTFGKFAEIWSMTRVMKCQYCCMPISCRHKNAIIGINLTDNCDRGGSGTSQYHAAGARLFIDLGWIRQLLNGGA